MWLFLVIKQLLSGVGLAASRRKGHKILTLVLSLSILGCSEYKTRPADTARITLPASQGAYGEWETLGYYPGTKVPDFTLYAADGKPFHLYEELDKGKALVLINGSYTCDISRGKLSSIKDISNRYDDRVKVVMVYTIDAHPSDTLSPYATNTNKWIPKNNIRDHISAAQPRTYGERVALSNAWIRENQLSMPVLIDEPNNEYWMEFGQAPNMCYIIDPDGVVRYRRTWYDEKYLDNEIQQMTELSE
ncbi:MAG TPA: deiodinase-like protein [Chryseolinea sp.]|nr:deiodinase-like protein [Chryseolinea sp.]